MPNFRYPHSPASLPDPSTDYPGFVALQSERDRSIEDYVSPLMPVGSILPYAGASAGAVPKGWRLCDGTAYSRDSYRNLFLALGTTWGTGDGSSTFNVPDLRGRTLVGQDVAQTEFTTVGQTGGSKTMVAGDLVAHDHGGATGSTTPADTGSTTPGVTGTTNNDHVHGTGGINTTHTHHPQAKVRTTNTAHAHDNDSAEYATSPSGTGTSFGTANVVTDGDNVGHNHGNTGGSSAPTHSHTSAAHTHTSAAHTHTIASAGSGNAGGKLPPYAVVRWIIKI